MVTLLASASCVWMMVVRFNFPVNKVLNYALISVGMLILLTAVAAPFAFVIHWLRNRNQDIDIPKKYLDEADNREESPKP